MESTIDVDVVQVMPPQELNITKVDGYYKAYSDPIKVDDYLGVELLVNYGAVSTSGAVEFVVQASRSEADGFTSMADHHLLGTEAVVGIPAGAARASGVDQCITRRIGYRGSWPWVRVGLKAKAPATLFVGVDAVLLKVNRG